MKNKFALVFIAAAIFGISFESKGMDMGSGRKVMVIAHRGASGYAPENTMVSFKRAYEMGAEMVELDVYKSSDGQLVIMHDDKVDRTTNGTGSIEGMTLEQIRKLDAGSKFKKEFAGEQVPTLDELLAWASGKIMVDIEIKGGGCEKKIVEMLKKYDMVEKVIVTSFNFEYIMKIKKLNPEVQTGALVGKIDNLDAIVKNIRPDAVVPNYAKITESNVEEAHKTNLQFIVYTVNDESSMKMMYKMGVDGIITNFPDMLIKFLKKTKRKSVPSDTVPPEK